ncbi:MAG: RNA polymerase subunit sigma-24 [Acidobacteria bacterium]|nr:MAG: RNA polymerase subunit sigma-24 [Acidobacteriota bacterium]
MMIVCDTGKIRIAPAHVNAAGFAASGLKVGEARSVRVDDTLLIRQAQQGNTAAFEELVRQYDRAVLRLAIHLTGSQEDGQDIYQEVFLRAYVNLARFRFECSFYTWIYRIVTNLCLDHLRKKNSRGLDVTTTVSPDGQEGEVLNRMPDHRPGASPERSLVGRELRRCIHRALGRLSPRERMIFELKHYHGLRLRTVAGILNTTEGTIKNTLYRATQKLRTQLAEVR